MKQWSSMMAGPGLQWFEYATNRRTARKMAVDAKLCTGTNGCPGVDHGAFTHIGTNIGEAWHQHDIFTKVATTSCNRTWDDTHSGSAELRCIVTREA